ncbi:hypothetical protein [Chryseobacterium sp. CT-SW4]|uniref:hypothetical protein n=1 Tax=Chryseobacterium sp. SW-1 TaxID=3157343 RepID=UPI003B029FA9
MKNQMELLQEEKSVLDKKIDKKLKLLAVLLFIVLLAVINCFLHYLSRDLRLGIFCFAIFCLMIGFIETMKIVKKIRFVQDDITDLEDEENRTQKGILTLVTGEKIESTFIRPKYKSNDYRDIKNDAVYHYDKVVGFKKFD